MSAGEEKAWEILAGMDPGEVCRRTDAKFDRAKGLYSLRSFNLDFELSPREKSITGDAPGSEILLQRLGYFFKLSVPWYMVGAKEVPPTGRLVNPQNLPGGQLFFRGTHVLPLDKLAAKYGQDREGFAGKGKGLGGEALNYGDASLKLFPLPRVPVVLILWVADEEFPPRADLLFDSTCELHLPLDIIWSVAMMSILIMM